MDLDDDDDDDDEDDVRLFFRSKKFTFNLHTRLISTVGNRNLSPRVSLMSTLK